MNKVVTVIGARPQFIKASVVSKELIAQNVREVIVHTGQHYDQNMSDVFFDQLNIPHPHYKLDIKRGTHGSMTGQMIIELEYILIKEKPNLVIVYGDTNSTLAGAIAASKLHIPIAHIEAGLRSFNMAMPEEQNRIITDSISKILFCPTKEAVSNLNPEEYAKKSAKIYNVGDVMQDSAEYFSKLADYKAKGDLPSEYILTTIHRAENTDNLENLKSIVSNLNEVHSEVIPVLTPLHPRTKKELERNNLQLNTIIIDPVGYLEMIWLIKNSKMVITDSGGLQKEAFFFKKPCITLREETEWVELIENGYNTLFPPKTPGLKLLVPKVLNNKISDPHALYGGGEASARIVKIIKDFLQS